MQKHLARCTKELAGKTKEIPANIRKIKKKKKKKETQNCTLLLDQIAYVAVIPFKVAVTSYTGIKQPNNDNLIFNSRRSRVLQKNATRY